MGVRRGSNSIVIGMSTRIDFLNGDFRKSTAFKSYGVKQKHSVEASEVTQRSFCESKAAFKRYLRIQLSSRSKKRSTVSARLWILRACL